MNGPIANYLSEIDHFLSFDPALARRVRDEIESHLLDAAEHWGEADAVHRFGRAVTIGRAYAEAALPDRVRRACTSAVSLCGATLLLMRLRTVMLDLQSGGDSLIWLDRGGLFVALTSIVMAWLVASRQNFETVRTWLHIGAATTALSVGASVLRALFGASGDAAFILIAATALAELALIGVLLMQLARLDRYANRLAS